MNKNTQSAIRWTACLSILAFICAVGLFLVSPFGLFVWQNAGFFNRDRMEAIVAEVRAYEELAAGEEGEFLLRDVTEPTAMQMVYVTERPSDAGTVKLRRGPAYDSMMNPKGARVCAARSSTGALAVAICTRNMGHAGEYGFAYLEHDNLDVPGGMFMYEPESKVEEHWYRVLNDLR